MLKNKREWNIGADDDRAAQIAQENPLNEEDQQAAENEVVHHRTGSHGDERRAVVKGHELHPRRQRAVVVYLLDLGANARHHVAGMQRAVHDDDGRDDIVLVVAAGLAEARHVADGNFGDVFHKDRHAVRLPKRHVLDIRDFVALRDIRGAAGVHQADAANIHRLLAHIDGASADIDIGVADRADDLRQRHVVGVELVQIDFDVKLLGGPAPSIELDDAGDGQQPPLQYPVLNGSQVGQAEMRRPGHLVPVDFADQAGGLDLRRDVVRQTDVLLQIDRSLGEREVIVDPVVERHPHEGETIERGRADDVDPRRRGEADLDRDRIVTLHLFRRQAGCLGGDFQNDRGRVRIGFDIELGKGEQAGAQEDK